MALIPFTTLQNADGSPVANGFLLVGLNQAAVSGGFVIGTAKINVPLDSNGNIIGSPEFATSASLEPPTAQYVLSIFTSTGQEVGYPTILVI
jgi:hypothetical protein